MTTQIIGNNSQRKIRGYTLIELLMGLLIGSILSAMAIPQVRSQILQYRLQGAVSSATWAIQSTRYQSLTEGYPYQVVFTKSNNQYQVRDLPTGATSYANIGSAVPLSGSPVALNQDTTLQFLPNGSVTATVGAQNFTITYQGFCQKVNVTNYGNISLSSCP
ncbi:MAG: prepilin-type N-terminal cleavage/methylation domain-containing protein [Acidobacteriia bacterium]|nr:prepilin-type N-terminal cleavage/methylation domain-containing protein [Terriglobia bacterium]